MSQSKVPLKYLFMRMIDVLVSLNSDTDISYQWLDLLIYLVRYNIFMGWKVVLWFILDIRPLRRFIILPTWLVLLKINPVITNMLIMEIRYEGTSVSF